jgi:hypothetical protein
LNGPQVDARHHEAAREGVPEVVPVEIVDPARSIAGTGESVEPHVIVGQVAGDEPIMQPPSLRRRGQ